MKPIARGKDKTHNKLDEVELVKDDDEIVEDE